MIYVVFSVIFSVTVSVIIKLARSYAVDTSQMIVWNYPVAVLLTWYFYRPSFAGLNLSNAPLPSYLALAVLLPGIFLAIAACIRYTGIVRTEVAQRLSLFIPLVAAFWLFDENPQSSKLLGIAMGFAAILCSIGWHRGGNSYRGNQKIWLFPLIVFFGMGIIDILFKTVAQYTDVPYTSSMLLIFCLAMTVSFIYLAFMTVSGKQRFSISAIFWGILLGAFNFGNILFYMKAHRALPENPSIVFSGVNIGVIALGAVVGMLVFNEKLSRLNKIGLILAVISVLIVYL